MYDRFLKIDELTRPDHNDIEPEDACYYLGEYTARGGFGASRTNDLIINLKKPVSRRGRPEWRYKQQAIQTIADDLRRILGRESIETFTFVPVPPSKARGDPEYDDRLAQILGRMADGLNADVRELVLQQESMDADHEGDYRASIQELVDNYYADQNLMEPAPERVFIFDDMLTNGRHFKAVCTVLFDHFPAVRCAGLFVARRVPRTDDLSTFF